MEQPNGYRSFSPKLRRKQEWGVRITWKHGQTGGGVLRRGLGPGRKGGTCDVFGTVGIYDDIKGFVFIKGGEILHTTNKHRGFEFLCRLDEVEAVWQLCNEEMGKLIYRRH
jgi:hypothetical protein